MTIGGLSLPLLLIGVTLAAWALFELIRFIREWRLTGLSGEARTTLVVMLGVVAAVWLDGVFTRFHVLALPGGRDLHMWVGLVAIWLGLALRAWAHWVLGDLYTTTVLIQHGHSLVTKGPYAVIRHPSYAGLCLVLLGVAFAGGSGASLIATAALLAAGFWYRIRVEERTMRAAFGADYDAYRARTWRLLPRVY